MTDRASLPVWFPIDNEYLSCDCRSRIEVRCGRIYFHAVTAPLAYGIANVAIFALKPAVAR
jgi:hypothetical protein